jgi:tripartite-type tricarboxylate transporter receptor subunit TctC
VKTLNAAVADAMKTPAVKESLAALGAEVVTQARATSQYLAEFVKSETETWASPIKKSGLQVE